MSDRGMTLASFPAPAGSSVKWIASPFGDGSYGVAVAVKVPGRPDETRHAVRITPLDARRAGMPMLELAYECLCDWAIAEKVAAAWNMAA